METKMWLHDNVQTVKDLKVFTVFQLRWLKTKREMNGFKLSNEKIQTKSTPKSSDRICSLHFVDGIPTEANPLPTMHMGYDTKRQKRRRCLFKHPLPAKKTRTKEGEMEIEIINNKVIKLSKSNWISLLLAEGYPKVPNLCWSKEYYWSTGKWDKWFDIGK